MSGFVEWHQALGVIGFAFVVGAYLLLQLGRISSNSTGYSMFNGIGAGLILISLIYDFNLSAFFVEFFWLLISIVGIARNFLWRLRSKTH